jgi:hypothetical protein
MQETTLLGLESQEFIQLRGYLKNAAGYTHKLESTKSIDIFRIKRGAETELPKHANIPNSARRLL